MTFEELQAAHLETVKENSALKEAAKTHNDEKAAWLTEKEKLLTANQKYFEEATAFYQGKNPFAESTETKPKTVEELLAGRTL